MKLKQFICILMLVFAALLLAGCATSSGKSDSASMMSMMDPAAHLDEVPAHERERCRIWLPGRLPPGQLPPMWNDGHAGRMSGAGDCRAMMAELPPGGMLIEAR